MTPLAHRVARFIVDLKGRKKIDDVRKHYVRLATPTLSGAHFFDVTDVVPLAAEIIEAFAKTSTAGEPVTPCTFLPAPVTWVEWCTESGKRRAASLQSYPLKGERCPEEIVEGAKDKNYALVTLFDDTLAEVNLAEVGELNLSTGRPVLAHVYRETGVHRDEYGRVSEFFCTACALLALINSPRIVGRDTHAPHKLMARKLAHAVGGPIGPIHPWHVIKLEITKPRDISDGEPHADKITGKRALHFCRKHIRIRLGKLEYVRAHWRGDPTVGIRRATYAVTAPTTP